MSDYNESLHSQKLSKKSNTQKALKEHLTQSINLPLTKKLRNKNVSLNLTENNNQSVSNPGLRENVEDLDLVNKKSSVKLNFLKNTEINKATPPEIKMAKPDSQKNSKNDCNFETQSQDIKLVKNSSKNVKFTSLDCMDQKPPSNHKFTSLNLNHESVNDIASQKSPNDQSLKLTYSKTSFFMNFYHRFDSRKTLNTSDNNYEAQDSPTPIRKRVAKRTNTVFDSPDKTKFTRQASLSLSNKRNAVCKLTKSQFSLKRQGKKKLTIIKEKSLKNHKKRQNYMPVEIPYNLKTNNPWKAFNFTSKKIGLKMNPDNLEQSQNCDILEEDESLIKFQ